MHFSTEEPRSPEYLVPETTLETTGTTPHPVRVGTIVWGAVIIAAGILIIISSQLNLNLDAGLSVMWLLLGSGVAMVAAGAVKLLHRRRP